MYPFPFQYKAALIDSFDPFIWQRCSITIWQRRACFDSANLRFVWRFLVILSFVKVLLDFLDFRYVFKVSKF